MARALPPGLVPGYATVDRNRCLLDTLAQLLGLVLPNAGITVEVLERVVLAHLQALAVNERDARETLMNILTGEMLNVWDVLLPVTAGYGVRFQVFEYRGATVYAHPPVGPLTDFSQNPAPVLPLQWSNHHFRPLLDHAHLGGGPVRVQQRREPRPGPLGWRGPRRADARAERGGGNPGVGGSSGPPLSGDASPPRSSRADGVLAWAGRAGAGPEGLEGLAAEVFGAGATVTEVAGLGLLAGLVAGGAGGSGAGVTRGKLAEAFRVLAGLGAGAVVTASDVAVLAAMAGDAGVRVREVRGGGARVGWGDLAAEVGGYRAVPFDVLAGPGGEVTGRSYRYPLGGPVTRADGAGGYVVVAGVAGRRVQLPGPLGGVADAEAWWFRRMLRLDPVIRALPADAEILLVLDGPDADREAVYRDVPGVAGRRVVRAFLREAGGVFFVTRGDGGPAGAQRPGSDGRGDGGGAGGRVAGILPGGAGGGG